MTSGILPFPWGGDRPNQVIAQDSNFSYYSVPLFIQEKKPPIALIIFQEETILYLLDLSLLFVSPFLCLGWESGGEDKGRVEESHSVVSPETSGQVLDLPVFLD